MLPDFMEKLEKMLENNNNGNEYFVGSEVSNGERRGPGGWGVFREGGGCWCERVCGGGRMKYTWHRVIDKACD